MIDSILVPIDFSVCSIHAAKVAIELASKSEATIHLLHIIKPEAVCICKSKQCSIECDLFKAKVKIKELINQVFFGSLKIITAVLSGEIVEKVKEYAVEQNVDMVIIGHFGGTGVDELDVGVNTLRIKNELSCPVLTVSSEVHIEKNKCLQKVNRLIKLKNDIIISKQKEINDSIKYAKRLLSATLPSLDDIRKELPDSFIFYKPKDIVSGDFYWYEKAYGRAYIAAVDCTGHGVPGALISIVCSNALNMALFEQKLNKPADILNKTREIIMNVFSKNGTTIRDGMDIALCSIGRHDLIFSGANNPLWIVRKTNDLTQKEKEGKKTIIGSDSSLIQVQPNKQPVGYSFFMKPFTDVKIKIFPNDSYYIFTDGFADQFGGEKGRKYKYRKFRELILKNAGKSMFHQKIELKNEFFGWKGNREQIDDVCVVGFRTL